MSSTNGQSQELPKDGPAFYFNSFQKYRNTNVDSSLYFARLLAMNPDDSTTLEDLLHNSFAQSFLIPSEELTNAMKTMDSLQKKEYQKMLTISPIILDRMMSDSNIYLVNTVKPINFWVKVQQNENNINEL